MNHAHATPQSPPAIREQGLRAAADLVADLGLGHIAPQVLSYRGSACRGPIEWDLAVLGSTPDEDTGGAALSAYGHITGTTVPSQGELAPWLRLRTLEGTARVLAQAPGLARVVRRRHHQTRSTAEMMPGTMCTASTPISDGPPQSSA